jgi:hypothetical protein
MLDRLVLRTWPTCIRIGGLQCLLFFVAFLPDTLRYRRERGPETLYTRIQNVTRLGDQPQDWSLEACGCRNIQIGTTT